MQRYGDLRRAFTGSTRYIEALDHYLSLGFNEQRVAGRVNLLTNRNIFNATYYLNNNPDLRREGITTARRAQQHWLEFGIYEGRRGSANFDVKIYLNRYPDLQRAFKGYTRFALAMEHYGSVGAREGRSGR